MEDIHPRELISRGPAATRPIHFLARPTASGEAGASRNARQGMRRTISCEVGAAVGFGIASLGSTLLPKTPPSGCTVLGGPCMLVFDSRNRAAFRLSLSHPIFVPILLRMLKKEQGSFTTRSTLASLLMRVHVDLIKLAAPLAIASTPHYIMTDTTIHSLSQGHHSVVITVRLPHRVKKLDEVARALVSLFEDSF